MIVINLRSDYDSRFIDVMKHAADEHKLFKFETYEFNGDQFVTSIGGEAQQPEE